MRRPVPGSCAVLAVAVWAVGCGRIDYDGSRTGIDAAPTAQLDATIPPDARDTDAGPVEDAEVGTPDAGPHDAGPQDAGPGDAGPRDAGPGDAGTGTGVVACTPACSVGDYCVVRAECANAGTCRPRPTPTTEMCPAVYAPVCGCDGTTYSNGCEAGVAGMPTAFTGTCAGGPIEI